jgi:hypothetical protein
LERLRGPKWLMDEYPICLPDYISFEKLVTAVRLWEDCMRWSPLVALVDSQNGVAACGDVLFSWRRSIAIELR